MKRIHSLSPSTHPPVIGVGRFPRSANAGQEDYPLQISAFRRRAGLTQSRLAEMIGVQREHLSRIERGRVYMSEPIELRIAHALRLVGDDHSQCFGYPAGNIERIDSRRREEEAAGAAAPIDLHTYRATRARGN